MLLPVDILSENSAISPFLGITAFWYEILICRRGRDATVFSGSKSYCGGCTYGHIFRSTPLMSFAAGGVFAFL